MPYLLKNASPMFSPSVDLRGTYFRWTASASFRPGPWSFDVITGLDHLCGGFPQTSLDYTYKTLIYKIIMRNHVATKSVISFSTVTYNEFRRLTGRPIYAYISAIG